MDTFFKLTDDQERDLFLAKNALSSVIQMADAFGRTNIDLATDEIVALLTIIYERLPTPVSSQKGGEL
jgi:hypothetical protein